MEYAVEPVEGLQLLAKGQEGSISAAPRGSIDIDAPVSENVENIARALGRRPPEITVAVLDRDRHEGLIEEYGFGDPERKLLLDDLIRGTAGESLEGVRYFRGGAHTVVMSTEPRVVRFMDTIHALEPEAGRRGFQL